MIRASLRTLLACTASLTIAACGGGGGHGTTPDPTLMGDGGSHPTETPTPTNGVTPTPTTDPGHVTCIDNGICVSHPRVSTEDPDYETLWVWECPDSFMVEMCGISDVRPECARACQNRGFDRMGRCELGIIDASASECRKCYPFCGPIWRHNVLTVREPECDGPSGTGCLYLRAYDPSRPSSYQVDIIRVSGWDDDLAERTLLTVEVTDEGTLLSRVPQGFYRLGYRAEANDGVEWTPEPDGFDSAFTDRFAIAERTTNAVLIILPED
jgi:hypothetical protein